MEKASHTNEYFTLLIYQLEKFHGVTNDELASNLLKNIRSRQAIILEIIPVYACMYLDPRYQCMLDENQKARARKHLVDLYRKINRIISQNEDLNESILDELEVSSASVAEYELDEESLELALENIISQKCHSMPNDDSNFGTNNTCIETLLNEFDFSGNKRMNSKESVRDYWQNNMDNRPELFKLASVIFAVQSTEVSTERNFSVLNFILNRYRNSLSDESLERIMFMKVNQNLFKQI